MDWSNRLVLAPLSNQQSHADITLSLDEYRWLHLADLRQAVLK